MFRCIKELILDRFDDDNEVIEGNPFIVKEGSEWHIEDYMFKENDIRLVNDEAEWIEIGISTLKKNFTEVITD